MAEVMGVGLTHYPPLTWPDAHMADLLRYTLGDPDIPAERKAPTAWPAEMRAEWGSDEGLAGAARHRAELLDHIAHVRRDIEAFAPEFLVVWGDDQYENYREECIPAFSVLALEDTEIRPWEKALMGKPNVWGEAPATTFTWKGLRPRAKELTSGLLEAGFDVAYAYRTREGSPFPHAFTNTLLFLDYDRTGFDVPMLPIPVNCYGRHVIGRRGGLSRFADALPPEDCDPVGPTPRRCFELGRAVGRFFAESPYRVVLCASSSWGHAFLTDSTWRLHPDMAADRRLYRALVDGDLDTWLSVTTTDIEAAGQQEILNWFCLLGAVTETNLQLDWSAFVETWVFNSNKCFGTWK